MTLDGIQSLLYNLQSDRANLDYKNGWCIRFADDMVILAKSENDAKKFKRVLSDFLEERGLKLSPNKTKIINFNNGEEFTFLARTYYKKAGIVHSKPSLKSKNKFKESFGELLFNPNTKWTPRKLVTEVNQKLNGWASYHRITEAKDAFIELDTFVSAMILRLIKELYPKLTNKQIINRFYWKASDGKYNFALASDRSCKIINLVDTILIKAKRIDIYKNYYIDTYYFKKLEDRTEIENVTGRYKDLWVRQMGKCAICGKYILDYQERKVIFKKLSRDKSINNLMYIHSFCDDSELVYVYGNLGDLTLKSTIDIINELQDFENGYRPKTKPSKFEKLRAYFQKSKKRTITLTFGDIEKILGFKLSKNAYISKSYFTGVNSYISETWKSQQYEIDNFDFENKKITFKKSKINKVKMEAPEWFNSRKLTQQDKMELIIYLDEFKRKKGL